MSTTVSRTPDSQAQGSRPRLLLMPEFWGTIAIASMWAAVLFTSIYGGDLVSVSNGGSDSTTVPTGIFVALFACFASISVARRAFRRD